MNFSTTLLITQVVISFLLIACILLQAQGTGLGGTWGGGGESFHTKRGVERVVFSATIVLGFLFAIVSILSVLFA